MSNSTPPGWYPDPEPAPGGAARERYWDGGGWTAQYRPADTPSAPAAQLADAPTQAWQGAAPAGPPPAFGAQVSDASPAYGHPAVPAPQQPPAPLSYGFPQPPPAPAPASYGSQPPAPASYGSQPPPAPLSYGFPPQAPAGYPPPVPQGGPGYPPPGPYAGPYQPQPAAGQRRTGLIVGILAGALLLVGGTVAVVLAGHKDSGSSASPAQPAPSLSTGTQQPAVPQPSAPGSADPGAPTTDPSAPQKAPVGPDGSLLDTVHGWSLPLPAGWANREHASEHSVIMTTGPYTCTMPGGCVRGTFAVSTGSVSAPDARTAAEQGMTELAPQLFGTLTAHQALTSGPVTVAGASGYAVRWHVTPTTGSPGYLLVVTVPAASGGGYVMLSGSVDDDPRAPKPAVLDQIISGVRAGAGTAAAAGTV